MSPTYRKSKHAIMKTRFKIHWHKVVVIVKGYLLIGQKLVENAKFEKLKCDILSNFQTMCAISYLIEKSSIGAQK